MLCVLTTFAPAYRIKTLRSYLRPASGPAHSVHSLHQADRTNFARLGCSGTYDRAGLSVLSGVCDRCYEVFKEHEVHSLCRFGLFRLFSTVYNFPRSDCFSTPYFTSCLATLMLGSRWRHCSVGHAASAWPVILNHCINAPRVTGVFPLDLQTGILCTGRITTPGCARNSGADLEANMIVVPCDYRNHY